MDDNTFDLREKIREHVADLSGFTVPTEAVKLAVAIDDDDFLAWALAHKVAIISAQMGSVLATSRAVATANRGRSAFADAASRFADSGDASAFVQTFVVDPDLTRKRVADLTAADCAFIADTYSEQSAALAFEASFHRALAKKLRGGRTISDVFTEETYWALRASLAAGQRAA